ncbi:site-specific DNA-methyltransferase [Candidatus Microgenomates bacterium]|nr:site-specific DNA-methyltransferase [Candidatus Microgenomates bacterium]
MKFNTIHQGDVLDVLRSWPDELVNCVVTSPPYWGLRDYGVAGQIGLEKTIEEYVAKMVEVFREVRRVLRRDGTIWINLGDSYWNGGGEKRDGGHDFVDGGKIKLEAAKGSLLQRKSITMLGLKPKDMAGMPWRVTFALQTDGWYLRSDIIWSKPNPMPESVTDRPTKSHEYLFLLSKSERYFYDAAAIKEPAIYFDDDRAGRDREDHKSMPTGQRNGIRPLYKDARSYDDKHSDKQRGHGRRHAGFNDRWDQMGKSDQCSGMRNKRSVWTVATSPFHEAHFATFPEKLIEPCILAGCPRGGAVLDPFMGAGTTGLVAVKHGRQYLGIELNPEYVKMAERRIHNQAGLLVGMT